MFESAGILEAANVIVSTRMDRLGMNQVYEDLIKRLLELHPKRIFLLSSVAVYGDSLDPRSEISKRAPVTLYGKSKALEEDILLRLKPNNCELVIFRISNVFGHIFFDDFVNHIFLSTKMKIPARVIDQGRTTRNFIWFDDLIQILSQLISIKSLPAVLNIGANNSINLQSLVNEIEIILDKKIQIVESSDMLDIVANSIIDTSELRQILNFKMTEIDIALRNYYLTNPELSNSL